MSMQSILSASMTLNRMQTMQSLQTQTQGRINVLHAEIKQDGGHDERKENQISELEERSSNIMDSMMDELKDVNETLKPSEDGKTGEAEKKPNTDQVDLSHPTEDTDGEGRTVRAEAAVSYNAEGKAEAEASPAGKKVDTKA